MAGQLDGKVAIITGGAQGIGAACVQKFVEQGARVVIADILDQAAKELTQNLGSAAYYRRTDVSKAGEMEALVDETVAHFGQLDILFSNAGVMGEPQGNFLDEDFSTFERTIAVDLLGPMLGARFAGAYMANNGGGCILTTASTSALYGGYGIVPYRAAKAGVIGMTRSLAIELGPHGIRVNTISPGPTKTAMSAAMDNVPEEQLAALMDVSMECMRGRMPLGRIGLPEDIANAAVFLASDLAAQITGIDLRIDGGETAGNVENTLAKMQAGFATALQNKQ
ncbi:MAG: glucose 1-dehydrogenase [Pseudomonadota bacterium]